VGGANVLVLDGDAADFIHPGYERLDGASWQSNPATYQSRLSFHIESAPGQKSYWWTAEMTSGQQTKALGVGMYANASRAAFAPPGTPGLDISGDGRGCNKLSGTFWIHEIDWSGDFLKHVLLAFEQHCENGSATLRGCINYTAPGAYPDAGAGP